MTHEDQEEGNGKEVRSKEVRSKAQDRQKGSGKIGCRQSQGRQKACSQESSKNNKSVANDDD